MCKTCMNKIETKNKIKTKVIRECLNEMADKQGKKDRYDVVRISLLFIQAEKC